MCEKCPKTKPSLKVIPMPDNLVGDLKKYKEWFRLADEFFDEMQYVCLAVGRGRHTRIQSRTYSPKPKQNTGLNSFPATDSDKQ